MSKRGDLVWADEVMEVYRCLNSDSDTTDLSHSAKYMLDMVRRDDNAVKFLSDTVPKATALLAKLRPAELDNAAKDIDRKTIAELQKVLKHAVRDCEAESDPDLLELLG